MPGARITSEQTKIYMYNRKKSCMQILSAAKAGISERSGRDIEHGKISENRRPQREWRTRLDPLASVWETEIVPMLKQGVYQGTFILGELQKKHTGQFNKSVLRSLQRRIKRWHALSGADKEVMFPQVHEPGQLGVSDFTHPKEIKVTINKEPLVHIFYHFRLPYSGWNYVQVFRGSGEPYTAFAQGLQEALHCLGGVPVTHRTDSLSASYKNLDSAAEKDLTERYKAFVEHYGMEPKRINPGEGHENGTIESSHRHVKERVEQSITVRGSNDFSSFQEYQLFIQDVVRQHNQCNAKNIEIERAALKSLPETKAAEYTEIVAVVSTTSTIDVKRVTYTVPSRLIGERLHVRIYHDKLDCYLGIIHAVVLVRQHKPARGKRARVIDYRHVINSLIKKPGAFRNCRFRDDLLPDDNYRAIWNHVNQAMNYKDSCKFIVGLLHIAATQDCENQLAHEVLELIKDVKPLKLSDLQGKFNKHKIMTPTTHVEQHQLSSYNQFIPDFQGASL